MHETSVTAHVSHDIPLTEIRRSAFGVRQITPPRSQKTSHHGSPSSYEGAFSCQK